MNVFAYISRHTGTFNCLSVCTVSPGGIKICSRKVGKIISLVLFIVVPDHRKSLTDPLPALVLDEQGNRQYFHFSHRTEKKTLSFCISKLEGDLGSY